MFFNSFFLEEFFTGKHLCQSLFFWHKCFPANSTKFLRTPFLQNTSEDCFCKCKVNTALPFYLKLFHYNYKYQWKKIKKKVRGLFNLKKQKQLSGGVLYGKVCLEIYCKFTGEHPCRSVISINLLLISRTPFSTEHLQTTLLKKLSFFHWRFINWTFEKPHRGLLNFGSKPFPSANLKVYKFSKV